MRRKVKGIKHIIRFGDTSVDRDDNLYRFQIDEYPDYDLLRVYGNNGRKGVEKKTKTVYDENGYAWHADSKTGALLFRKLSSEIKKCVDLSLQRTRRVVREILMANSWDWFITVTFNNIAQNRADDSAVYENWEKFRRYIRLKYPNMYYLAVPERHKSGCIHFHFLAGGISKEELKLAFSGHYDKNGREIYNCNAWRYGFSTVTEVEDTEKAAGYLLKYIGKDLGVSMDFKKRYWASRNCNRPKKRFVDMVCDFTVNVLSLFDSMVERTVGMIVKYWNKVKNYLVVRDNLRDLRKIRFWFDQFNESAHDDFWRSPC